MAKKARVWDGANWQELASAQTDLTAYSTTAQTTAGFRNAIINGDFRIWQRGTSFSAAGYTADRWIILADGSGATRSISQQVFTPGNAISGYEPVNFLRYNQSVAGTSATFNIIEQRIEDVRTYAGQTVTVSFWAKTDSARTVTSQVQQNFGTGGSAEVEAINPSNIALTTSWQRFTYTATMPSISGKTIGTNAYVAFRINIPTNATFTVDVWGVQIEKGTVATPFEQRPIGTELALCHRYYRRNDGGNDFAFIGTVRSITSTNIRIYVPLIVPFRTKPAITVAGTVRYESTGGALALATGSPSAIYYGNSTQQAMVAMDHAITGGPAGGTFGDCYALSGAATNFIEFNAEL